MKNLSILYCLIFYFLRSDFLLDYNIIIIPATLLIFLLSCTNQEETRQLIQNSLRPYWQNQNKQRILQEIRSHINLVTYPEKLKLIHLN